MFKALLSGAKKGVSLVATGNVKNSVGLNSPHLPAALVRIGRFLYTSSGVWIGICWYSGYANKRTAPGSGPTLVIPGTKKAVNPPDRPNPSGSTFGITSASSVQHSNSAATGNSGQYVTTPDKAGRKLIAISPAQLGVPGTAVAGYLWSAPNADKQMPKFDRARYNGLLAIANQIGRQFGLRISSGYRAGSQGASGPDLHSVGLAFDLVGPLANLKRAASWGATNPSLFQEIFVHNEGSGVHLHLGFYPDAAGIFNAGTNRYVRPGDRRQPVLH